jgi:hypothetical protein
MLTGPLCVPDKKSLSKKNAISAFDSSSLENSGSAAKRMTLQQDVFYCELNTWALFSQTKHS